MLKTYGIALYLANRPEHGIFETLGEPTEGFKVYEFLEGGTCARDHHFLRREIYPVLSMESTYLPGPNVAEEIKFNTYAKVGRLLEKTLVISGFEETLPRLEWLLKEIIVVREAIERFQKHGVPRRPEMTLQEYVERLHKLIRQVDADTPVRTGGEFACLSIGPTLVERRDGTKYICLT